MWTYVLGLLERSPHTCSPFSSDQPCPRPEEMLWGLSSAVHRPEDGSGLWGPEALPADGLEQAHSGECQLCCLCSLPSLWSTLSCSPSGHWRPTGSACRCFQLTSESRPIGPLFLHGPTLLWAFLQGLFHTPDEGLVGGGVGTQAFTKPSSLTSGNSDSICSHPSTRPTTD